MATPIPAARRFFYALGHPGFQITDRIVVLMAVYFYLPPPGRGLETRVQEEAFLGFLTVYGLATLVGRLFDAARSSRDRITALTGGSVPPACGAARGTGGPVHGSRGLEGTPVWTPWTWFQIRRVPLYVGCPRLRMTLTAWAGQTLVTE